MKLSKGVMTISAALAVLTITPVAAIAQSGGTQAQRSANLRTANDLRGRIATADVRITTAQRNRAITPARAATLRRQITQVQSDMARRVRQQGFVSAGELASYNRTLGEIDVALDHRGVERGYGNDALVASPSGRRAEGLQYDCQNEPLAIAIPGDRLDAALAALRTTTRCPISGTELARGKRSQPVVGTMTPNEALQAMLNGTGLQMRSIKGGFEVLRLPRR